MVRCKSRTATSTTTEVTGKGGFIGCKAALLHGQQVLAYRRDDRPGLPWADHWDLPGGGREGAESPQDCVLREIREEFGLILPAARLVFHRIWPSIVDPRVDSHFFAGHLGDHDIAAIRFGEEGQEWQMMPLAQFLGHPRAVPEMQRRLGVALAELFR